MSELPGRVLRTDWACKDVSECAVVIAVSVANYLDPAGTEVEGCEHLQ